MQNVACLIPLLLSGLGAARELWWLHLAAVCTMFALIALLPVARGRENVLMYTLTALSLIPMNLVLISYVWRFMDFMEFSLVRQILWALLIYCALLNLEEILLGVATRLIWKRQRRNIFCDPVQEA